MAAKVRSQNQRLRSAREQRGWTQKDVADQIDLPDVRTFRRWERGEAFPSLRYRAKLCELFAMSAEALGLIHNTDPDLLATSLPGTPSFSRDTLSPEHSGNLSDVSSSFLKHPVSSKKQQSSSMDWNRGQLLKKVQAFWINDVLEKSLHNSTYLKLELREEPGAVKNVWEDVINQEEISSPFDPGMAIIQVYDDAGGELLILGEPGSGKTTLLLEIARNLLLRALADEKHLIPVVFNLSSWSPEWESLEDWFVDELNAKYQVPLLIGQKWIGYDTILPLLDGLDEVNLAYRDACVSTICAYRRERGLVPMVVCSRRQDYLNLESRLLLQKAVSIQPLTPRHIDEYLLNGGEHLNALREAFYADQDLQALLVTPLMLTILNSSFQDHAFADFKDVGSSGILYQRIFTTYVKRVLAVQNRESSYTLSQSIHWLRYLAHQMRQHYQTEFYLERMQLDWLPSHRLRQICHGLVTGIWAAAVGGALIGFIAVLLGKPIFDALVIMPLIALVIGLVTGVSGTVYEDIWATPLKKIGVGAVSGMLVGCGVVELGTLLNWSDHLLIGAVIGVVIVLTFILLDERSFVNSDQGIHSPTFHAIRSGTIVALLNGLILMITGIIILQILPLPGIHLYRIIFDIVVFALITGLITGMNRGGDALLRHLLLRSILWLRGDIPWDYAHFLDYIADHALLRKIGSGYIFAHSLLLDYFATLEETLP